MSLDSTIHVVWAWKFHSCKLKFQVFEDRAFTVLENERIHKKEHQIRSSHGGMVVTAAVVIGTGVVRAFGEALDGKI